MKNDYSAKFNQKRLYLIDFRRFSEEKSILIVFFGDFFYMGTLLSIRSIT